MPPALGMSATRAARATKAVSSARRAPTAAAAAVAAAAARPAAAATAAAQRLAPLPHQQQRYALLDVGPTAGPQPVWEGMTYTLSRRAVARAAAAAAARASAPSPPADGPPPPPPAAARRPPPPPAAERLFFEHVVLVRTASGASFEVPGAWVEGEVLEHLEPSPFAGALSRFRVTRIVAPSDDAGGKVRAAAGGAAVAR